MQQRYQAIEELLQNLPRGPVVDIGFGAGESLEILAREGFAPLVGYELDANAFYQGRHRMAALGLPCQLWMKDATYLEEIPNATLALIHSRSAFQYFPFHELAHTVGRKLRPGGHLVVMVPSLHYYLNWKSHVANLKPSSLWRLFSYPRAVCRTLLLMAAGWQPGLGGAAPEIAWTAGLVRRFARCAGMDVTSVQHRGWMFEVVLRKVIAE